LAAVEETGVPEHTIPLGSDRKLQALEAGSGRGVPVFSLHGTPGNRFVFPPLIADAGSKGIRLIGYDRPGYGGSTAAPGRTIASIAVEVSAIADALGIERFGVWGFSGGGAPSLACSALLGKRVVGAACIAGVAPYGAPGLDWLAGMGESNVEDFSLLIQDRAAWEKKGERDRLEMVSWGPDDLRRGFQSLCSKVDQDALTDEVADWLLQQARDGMKDSAAGMRDDNLSDILPWGFDVGSIRGPVQIWHGGEDRFVPFAHGRWFAEHVPGAEAHLRPDLGHLSLFTNAVPQIHDWLLAKF
jgi:pimeloyl-ACP methyl ester carboxylesterase